MTSVLDEESSMVVGNALFALSSNSERIQPSPGELAQVLKCEQIGFRVVSGIATSPSSAQRLRPRDTCPRRTRSEVPLQANGSDDFLLVAIVVVASVIAQQEE